jgi:phosphonate transport system permease protein
MHRSVNAVGATYQADTLKARYGPSKIYRAGRLLLLFAVLLGVSAYQAEVNLLELVKELPKGATKLAEFWPPDWSALPSLIEPALVTMLMALIPLPIGLILSIPIALAASQNISPQWLRLSTRVYITLQRNLPEFILVLILVRAFGLGPLPGIVALVFGSIGMLGKLVADAIEEIDQSIIDNVAITGASWWQTVRYAVIPVVMPNIIANTIFRFEINMRQAGLLGAVGAGGLGWELAYALNLLEYERVTMTFLVLLLLVTTAELVSDQLRRRLGGLRDV